MRTQGYALQAKKYRHYEWILFSHARRRFYLSPFSLRRRFIFVEQIGNWSKLRLRERDRNFFLLSKLNLEKLSDRGTWTCRVGENLWEELYNGRKEILSCAGWSESGLNADIMPIIWMLSLINYLVGTNGAGIGGGCEERRCRRDVN